MADDKKDMPDKMKSTSWRVLIAFLLVFSLLYFWNRFLGVEGPPSYSISYTQFIDQLDAANIKSVTIKKSQVTGEFIKEVNIQFPGEKKALPVKRFITFLPSFQGEGLLAKQALKDQSSNLPV